VPRALQLLEAVAWEFGDIAEYSSGESVQSGFRSLTEWLELPDVLAASEAPVRASP